MLGTISCWLGQDDSSVPVPAVLPPAAVATPATSAATAAGAANVAASASSTATKSAVLSVIALVVIGYWLFGQKKVPAALRKLRAKARRLFR